MIGVVSILGVLGLAIAGVMFLIEWPMIRLTSVYMELEGRTWLNAAKLSSLIIIFNIALSAILALLKMGRTLSLLIGLALFVTFVYAAAGRIYEITKRQRLFFTLILLIFSIVINFLLVFLMKLLVLNIKIM